MHRTDWWWLLVKAAGLWLVVDGLARLPALAGSFRDVERFGDGPRAAAPALQVLLPVAAGLLLIFFGPRWLGVPADGRASAQSAPAPADRVALTREDLLWVGIKLVGLWLVVVTVNSVFSDWFWSGAVDPVWAFTLWVVPAAALGLWLLFGRVVFRLASRG